MKLAERHRMIATLAASGMMKKEIAERVGCHPNTVTRVLKNPLIREMVDDIQKTVQQETITNLVEEFNNAAPAAFRQLMKLMTSGPPSVSFRASESILDRSQTAPKRQIHTKHDVEGGIIHLHVPASKLREFEKIALETGKPLGLPLLQDDEELVAEIDAKTGEVISERVVKI